MIIGKITVVFQDMYNDGTYKNIIKNIYIRNLQQYKQKRKKLFEILKWQSR